MFARAGIGIVAVASIAGAQQQVRVEVRDDQGAPVSFALVAMVGGNDGVVSSDSGVANFRARAADSLNLRVRRIGYREHFGWVKRQAAGAYRVTLPRVAATLATVEVNAAPANTPLAQRGFYDRAERVRKGAILGDFFTPEQLDEREGFTKITQMIAGSRYARVTSLASDAQKTYVRAPLIVSNRGCAMTILLDGRHVTGTVQDTRVSSVPQSILPGGSVKLDTRPLSIDDVIDGRSIMAIEIYPSSGNAPAELVSASGQGSCGIIALWTGGRR